MSSKPHPLALTTAYLMDADNRRQEDAMPAYMVADLASRLHRFAQGLRAAIKLHSASHEFNVAMSRARIRQCKLAAALEPINVQLIRPLEGINRFVVCLQFPGQLNPHFLS